MITNDIAAAFSNRTDVQLEQDRKRHLELIIANDKSDYQIRINARKELSEINKRLLKQEIKLSQTNMFDNSDSQESLF